MLGRLAISALWAFLFGGLQVKGFGSRASAAPYHVENLHPQPLNKVWTKL